MFDLNLFRSNRLFLLSNLTSRHQLRLGLGHDLPHEPLPAVRQGLSDPQMAGLVLVAGVVLQTVLSPFGGRLSDKVQPRWVVSTGMGFCVVGLAMLASPGFTTPYWLIFVALCLLGVGYALFSGPNQAAIMGSVERKDVGPAGAMVGTMRVVGPGAERGARHPGACRDRGPARTHRGRRSRSSSPACASRSSSWRLLCALSVVTSLVARRSRAPRSARKKPVAPVAEI